MRYKVLTLNTAIALFLPTAASTQAIAHERVSVAATNDEWTPTTIQVERGDVILVLAAGRVRIGQVTGEVGPNGNSSGDGVLFLKIGVGAGQRVGERAFIIADQSGPVKLRVHDNRYGDNAGAFEVSVIHIPGSLIPMPGEGEGSPATANTASLASVRSDLRNLVTAEEAYFADSVRYATSLRALRFQPSPGVTIRLGGVTTEGWNATATHAQAPRWTCGIFVGSVPPDAAVQKEGQPVCWQSK